MTKLIIYYRCLIVFWWIWILTNELSKLFQVLNIKYMKPVSQLQIKKNIKKHKIFHFLPKKWFLYVKKYFFICSKIYSERFELDLSDATIKIQNSHFSLKLWWNYYDCIKFHVSISYSFREIKWQRTWRSGRV